MLTYKLQCCLKIASCHISHVCYRPNEFWNCLNSNMSLSHFHNWPFHSHQPSKQMPLNSYLFYPKLFYLILLYMISCGLFTHKYYCVESKHILRGGLVWLIVELLEYSFTFLNIFLTLIIYIFANNQDLHFYLKFLWALSHLENIGDSVEQDGRFYCAVNTEAA